MPYPFLSKILSKNLSFSTGIAITKDFAKASVNGTIDNIQYSLFFGFANAIAIAQCERNFTGFTHSLDLHCVLVSSHPHPSYYR